MKVYQFKHNEIFIVESFKNEERVINGYDALFEDILYYRNISDKRIFEVLNLCNYSIKSAPIITKEVFRKKTLPAFQFLMCKN
jgi:hypothetical protein